MNIAAGILCEHSTLLRIGTLDNHSPFAKRIANTMPITSPGNSTVARVSYLRKVAEIENNISLLLDEGNSDSLTGEVTCSPTTSIFRLATS